MKRKLQDSLENTRYTRYSTFRLVLFIEFVVRVASLQWSYHRVTITIIIIISRGVHHIILLSYRCACTRNNVIYACAVQIGTANIMIANPTRWKGALEGTALSQPTKCDPISWLSLSAASGAEVTMVVVVPRFIPEISLTLLYASKHRDKPSPPGTGLAGTHPTPAAFQR